ncbi:MAG: right-handed parallel beta-helix repeat-containing protein, partial [Myxococcota bacterium]
GIELVDNKNNKILINGCKIYKNYYNGIFMKDNSDVLIEGCEIYENGNNKEDYPQIWVEGSNCEIRSTSVYNGVNATGICIYDESSRVRMKGVKTYNNKCGIFKPQKYELEEFSGCNIEDGIY